MLIDKVPDGANVAVGALFFGQFLGDRPFSFMLAAAGAGVWLILMACAIVLGSGRANT